MSGPGQKTESRAIPTRRVTVSDSGQLPHDYSTTPGGTLFSTTPGGTRIIYDRKFLMECRNSPVARTPPRDLPNIPGVTSRNATEKVKPATNHVNSHEEKAAGGFHKLVTRGPFTQRQQKTPNFLHEINLSFVSGSSIDIAHTTLSARASQTPTICGEDIRTKQAGTAQGGPAVCLQHETE